MKRFVCVLLAVAMLAALPITAFANLDVKAVYTASSSFEVGGTASVDEAATCAAVMALPNIDAAMYNAALERSVEYRWVCPADEQAPRSGKSITWTAEDVGKEFYCQIFFYNNGEYVDFVNGEPREITGRKTEFKVLTTQLPAAIVGQKYSAQLKASEEDAKFEEDRYSQLSEFGLTLSKSGVISGTPTKAGNCHVNLIARVQGGEATANLDITVTESTGNALKILTEELPAAIVGVAYSFKLECTDPDVRWELFRSSLPDGMYLTQHGEIEGTPTKAGNYYVVVMATPEAGADYAATAEFELTILAEDAQLYTMEIWEGPKKTEYISGEKLDLTGLRVRIYGPDGYLDSVDGKYLTYTNQPLVTLGEQKISLRYEDAFDVIIVTVKAAPGGNTGDPTEPGTEATTENTGDATEAVTEPGETTDSAKPSKSPAQKGEKDRAENQDNDTDGGDIWFFVAIGLGVLVVGLIVAIVVILKKKKA